jgi:probable HAF family extracellular repeat protein
MQDIAPINSGDIRGGPLALNNLGHIASGVVIGDTYYPAIYEPQGMRTTTLGSLGRNSGFTGVATALNDFGATVGYSYLTSDIRHAFLYRAGSMMDLGSLGGYSGALAINNSGMIAGFSSQTPNGFSRAVFWQNTSIFDISNGLESEARGINDSGQVVGETTTPLGNRQAFLWSSGISHYLGTLPTGQNSEAYGINNQGDVVGIADVISSFSFVTNPINGKITTITNLQDHAFLYQNGAMIDLNSMISTNSGWELYSAYGINNSDQIVGWGSLDGGEHFRSFILQVPEPGAAVLLAPVAAALLIFRNRRGFARNQNFRDSSDDRNGWKPKTVP